MYIIHTFEFCLLLNKFIKKIFKRKNCNLFSMKTIYFDLLRVIFIVCIYLV